MPQTSPLPNSQPANERTRIASPFGRVLATRPHAMQRARCIFKIFAAVFVCFNVLFFALVIYVLAVGFGSMDTGEINHPLLYSFCSAVIEILMLPSLLFYQLPEDMRTDALEWTLILLTNITYSAILTAILLGGLRWVRKRTRSSAPAPLAPHHSANE